MIEADPTVSEHICDHCAEPFRRSQGFVFRGDDAHAMYLASCYHHAGHEVFIDAVFSPTWDEDKDDNVTLGCRVGPVVGQRDPAASIVAGATAFADAAVFGQKLTREEALAHPFLSDFWEVVDHILVHDPLVREHLYGPDARFV